MARPKRVRLVTDDSLKDKQLPELQALFNELDAGVKVATPQVEAMEATAAEARMILDDMKYRRGHMAYWLTLRKGQR